MFEKKFYSINEAATLLGVARISLYRWTKSGYLPSAKLGSRVLISAEDLKTFVQKNARVAV